METSNLTNENNSLSSLDEALHTNEEYDTRIYDEKVLKDMVAFMSGKLDKTPKSLEQLLTNLQPKLISLFSAQIVQNSARSQKLFQTLGLLEEELTDPVTISSLSVEDKIKLYQTLEKACSSALESQRKFLVQQKEYFRNNMTSVESIAQKLLSLPEDQFDKIVKIINQEQASEEEAKE